MEKLARLLVLCCFMAACKGPNPAPEGFEDFHPGMSVEKLADELMSRPQMMSEAGVVVGTLFASAKEVPPGIDKNELVALLKKTHGEVSRAGRVDPVQFVSLSVEGFEKVEFEIDTKWDKEGQHRIGLHVEKISFWVPNANERKYNEWLNRADEKIGHSCKIEDHSGSLCVIHQSCDYELCKRDTEYSMSMLMCGDEGPRISISLSWADPRHCGDDDE